MSLRQGMTIRIFFMLAGLVSLAACAPPFSRQALDQVDRSITYSDLQSDPDRFRGKWTMLGGMIIGTKNTREGSSVEVLQKPVGRRGRPLDTDASQGRFLIESDQFMDSAVYQPGKMITVIGEIIGQKTRPIGELQYRYPVVKSHELQLWEPSAGPQVHFGVGIGIFHSY